MADPYYVYDAHDLLDAAGVDRNLPLTSRIRFLIEERNQLRRQLFVGQCLRMAAWCKSEGRDYDAYRMLAIAQRPELAEVTDA